MSSRDAAKKRAGSTTDDATEGRSGRRNPSRLGRCSPSHRRRRAAPTRRPTTGYVAVIEVSGLLDEVLVDFVETQIAEAEDGGRHRPRPPAQQRRRGRRATPASTSWSSASRPPTVPVDVWVGPVGQPGHRRRHRRCWRPPAPSACAGGSRVEITPVLLGDGTLDGEAAVGDKVSAGEAVDLGLVDNAAPTIGVFVYGEQPGRGPPGRRERRSSTGSASPSPRPASRQLPLGGQLLHTVASPPVAYLLFVIGLALIVFELFTAGVGVAGLVGAGCLVLGLLRAGRRCPPTPSASACCCSPCSASPSTCRPACPGCGAASPPRRFTVGSVLLYDGLSLSWITLLVAIGGIALAMIGGMPAMVRSRFSTPTIGREWMVGEVGTAAGPDRPGRHRHRPRRPVAGPHQPGHPDRRRRAGAGGVDRRAAARGRAARRARPRTTATGAEPARSH